jgi:hypothetical protein
MEVVMKTFWYSFGMWWLVTTCILGLIYCARDNSNNGIYASPSGEASLVAGEACTINTDDHRPANAIWTDMTWCLETTKMDRRLRGLP